MSRRDRPDHWSQKARGEGFAARSVYKLAELDRRFSLVRSGDVILDVGAAPGSWSQYAARRVGRQGRIVAVDLQEMGSLERLETVTTIRGDIFEEAITTRVRELGPFDLVMSDAAPNTSGNRTLDTARSTALVEQVIALCDTLLSPGGRMVAKVFQGGDERELLEALRTRFATARLVKPQASRSESFETFLVGTGFGGPTGAA